MGSTALTALSTGSSNTAIGAGAGEALEPTKKPEQKNPVKAALLGGAAGAAVGQLSKPGNIKQLRTDASGQLDKLSNNIKPKS